MALSARVPSAFKSTASLVPAVWSKDIAEAVHNNLVCWPLFATSYEKELNKGDTLYIGKTNTVSATEVVVGTPSAAGNPFNTANVTLVINKWFDAKIPIDDMSARQTHIDVWSEARREAIYAISKQVDTTVNALFQDLNGSTVLGTDGGTITDAVLLSAWETLSKNDVPEEDRFIITNPSGIVDFMKEEKLVSTMYGMEGPVNKGFRGFHKVYGMPVYMTNNLTNATTGAYAVMAHKDAIAGAMQEEPEVELYDVPTEHQVYLLVTGLWGAIEKRDTFGVPIFTRSR